MRAIKALLVGATVLTVSVGTTAASQAMGWERPWAAHTTGGVTPPAAHRGGDQDGHHKDHHKGPHKYDKGKGNEYQLVHSCKGKFGYSRTTRSSPRRSSATSVSPRGSSA